MRNDNTKSSCRSFLLYTFLTKAKLESVSPFEIATFYEPEIYFENTGQLQQVGDLEINNRNRRHSYKCEIFTIQNYLE